MQELTSEYAPGAYSAIWDPSQQLVKHIDFYTGNITSINLQTGERITAKINGVPATTFVVPVADQPNRYLVSNQLTPTIIEWSGTETPAEIVEAAFTVNADSSLILNAAKASPKGNFYGNTLRSTFCVDVSGPNAVFVIYDKQSLIENVDVPAIKALGGFAWNAERTKVYQASTCEKKILEFDYDDSTGEMCMYSKMKNSNR